jgi:hypothetical protein
VTVSSEIVGTTTTAVGRVAAVASHDACDLGANLLRQLKSLYDVCANVLLKIAAAN